MALSWTITTKWIHSKSEAKLRGATSCLICSCRLWCPDCEATWHEVLVMASTQFVLFFKGRSSAPTMENPCGRSIYGGNPSPPPAVLQCRKSGQTGFCKPLLARERKAPELDLYSLFYYSRTKLLFTATLCATVRMIAMIPPPLASHQPKCLNLIQSDAYIHKIRAEGFKAVFGRGDSWRGETQSVPLSPLTRSCSLKAPEAKILSMRGSKLHWANLPIIVKKKILLWFYVGSWISESWQTLH